MSEIFFQHEKRNFVFSISIYYIKTNEIPNIFTFDVKGVIFYVTTATVIFSFAKISCFCAKAQLVFH